MILNEPQVRMYGELNCKLSVINTASSWGNESFSFEGWRSGEHTKTVLKYTSYSLNHLQWESIRAFCVIKNVQKPFKISKQKRN